MTRGPIRTVYTPFRMFATDREWYQKLAHATGKSLSEVLRDALTAYRAIAQLPGIASMKPLGQLESELREAYKAGVVADVPNDTPKKARGAARKGK